MKKLNNNLTTFTGYEFSNGHILIAKFHYEDRFIVVTSDGPMTYCIADMFELYGPIQTASALQAIDIK